MSLIEGYLIEEDDCGSFVNINLLAATVVDSGMNRDEMNGIFFLRFFFFEWD